MNQNVLKKDEILWLYNHRCKHGHRYTEHPRCYEDEHDPNDAIVKPEKIGFLDIEASNLDADFGYILSYCIKKHGGEILECVLSTEEVRNYIFDKNLVVQLVRDITEFDRLIVYWGKDYRFDVPYVRTRALHWNIPFPYYRELWVEDCYNIVKAKLKLHRNRLATACDYFQIPSKGHRLNPEVWQRAMAGEKASLDYILEHNREDVISLEMLWDKLNGFTNRARSSI